MLETPFPSFISQKPGEIPIFGTFMAKKSIFMVFAYISEILEISVPAMHYDVTVTSYMGCLYFFWYVWKEETHTYTMVPNKHI